MNQVDDCHRFFIDIYWHHLGIMPNGLYDSSDLELCYFVVVLCTTSNNTTVVVLFQTIPLLPEAQQEQFVCMIFFALCGLDLSLFSWITIHTGNLKHLICLLYKRSNAVTMLNEYRCISTLQ